MKKYKPFFALVILYLVLFGCGLSDDSSIRNRKDTVNTMVINDFENSSSLINLKGTISLSKKFTVHGHGCLELNSSETMSLWFETQDFPKDWSNYEFLKFDIFNPSTRLYFGTIQIFDDSGTDEQAEFHGQSYYGEEKLFLNRGWNHFEFLLQHAMVEEGDRPLALNKIRKLRFSFGYSDTPLFLDNIRLVNGKESRHALSHIDPRDCIVLIDNRDVYPSLAGPSEKIEVSDGIIQLRKQASGAVEELKKEIRVAELQGFQTLYQRIPLITADIGMGIRSKLVWFQDETEEREILNYVISSCNIAAGEISDMLAARKVNWLTIGPENEVSHASLYVPPYPPLHELEPEDGFYRDKSGNPIILFSMLQINEGPLMDYFAPFNHRIESYTVGGGSRYNIESSPVYEAFYKYPGTHRVGWDGWCGHLIKDRWAMGGKKEDVVICLESPHIREAVLDYMKMHHREWTDNPNLLYNIMAYELQYLCYCDISQQMFRDWLKSKYGDIRSVNKVWRTSYSGFAEIVAPETRNARPVDGTNRAAWYDWANFNTRRFTDYLKWIKTEMRKFDQVTSICAGGTSSMLSSSNSVSGIDEEMIINEVDDVILNESGRSPIFSDLLLSLSTTKKVMVDPEMGGGTHGILLQFLHGKSDISKWWWAGSPSKEYLHMNESSLPHSKEISLSDIDEVLRLGLDVRRLGSEIAEFTKVNPEIAILYSKTSIVQVPPLQVQAGRTPYIDAVYSVWEGARFLGCRIGFVSENQILAGKLAKIKMLIIPAVKYIRPEIVTEIRKYIENGGTAVIIPESFIFDQFARENNRVADFGITISGVTLPAVTGQAEKTQNYDQSFSQAILYGEVREKITCINDDLFSDSSTTITLLSDGLVQKINPGSNKVLARFEDGDPAIVLVKEGKGSLYYLAAPLRTADYHILFEPLALKTGLIRPLVGIGKDGHLVTGAEVRAVEREKDYLVYASNLTSETVEFDLNREGKIGSVLDLRTMTEYENTHLKLNPYQETIFKIEKTK
ncbi:MAG: hypothetical protein A2X05_15240 [Bacteroidetes bacterium GWE2_41_25]|nr:MAG: hypothetical protein A2X03_07185 [Bacteroidetes bacterium GWA2_40_15]OFX99130.1 MAG: hypothetical protein A2X06_09105 [Bacteroidetes bacterium GWC2_40_22]OFY10861.1 MAG: hypothetical protein A2X05_15240 [Bacteroidetes bacterium GWE2_41_25]HAM10628.1 hypothetical protein [Bacteroidales bacterium]HBH83449.1 hypothetical protein [Bacteroidales bacterium]